MICQHHTINRFYLDYIEQCEQTVYTHNFHAGPYVGFNRRKLWGFVEGDALSGEEGQSTATFKCPST